MEMISEYKMLESFLQKSREYGLENRDLFIGSRSKTSVEYSTKQEISFNLSERKDYQKYEYAVKWISSRNNESNQLDDDDIYIVWPIKESKCRTLTLSAFDFKRKYKNNGLQTILKKSNNAEYDVWLFKRKYVDEFIRELLKDNKYIIMNDLYEEIERPFETSYTEGGKRYYLGTDYERDSKLRVDAINKFRVEHDGKLFCELCEFDFSKKYGDYGADYIEVHHIKPLAEDERGKHKASVDELICVCSNCHRMLHHKRPAIKPEELKKIIISK